jgi:hypothetical protein
MAKKSGLLPTDSSLGAGLNEYALKDIRVAMTKVIDLIVLIIIIACCYRMGFVLFLLNIVYLFLARTKVGPQKR